MSLKRVFRSILDLFVLFSFFFVGAFFLILPHSSWRLDFFEKSPQIGLAFLGAGSILLFFFYLLNKGKYLVIKMGTSIDAKAITKSIEDCFIRVFDGKIHLKDVEVIRKSRLKIVANILVNDGTKKQELLEMAEKELSLLLRTRFGYTKPFYFDLKI